MTTLGQLVPFIIASLLAMAALIPGINAVDRSVKDLIESKKQTSKEYCYAKVERTRKNLDDANTIRQNQRQCEIDEAARIDADYATSLKYISCIKELVEFSGVSGADETSISASASTCRS
jgi:hypothetical protein